MPGTCLAPSCGKPARAQPGHRGDLQCTDAYTCPGAHPSFLNYFSGSPAWDYADWGWAYHTAQNGNWLNADSGNTDDITG